MKESKKRIYDLALFFVIEHVVLQCYYTCYMTVSFDCQLEITSAILTIKLC